LGLRHWVKYWGSTSEERAADYPCDGCRPQGANSYFRAIGVKASPALTYRWLCQLTQAPYSYDLIDNRGHRSPRELTPGADHIEGGVGVPGPQGHRYPAGPFCEWRCPEEMAKVFGPMSATYAVLPGEAGGSRIVVKIWIGASGRFGRLKRLRRLALALGDVVMMRKQLTTLRSLAERDQRLAEAT
jgi:hypothetical protein